MVTTWSEVCRRAEEAKKKYPPRKWSELTATEREEIQRTCPVRLWGDATDDTVFGKNLKGEWCRY
jgi:hypothetical protein